MVASHSGPVWGRCSYYSLWKFIQPQGFEYDTSGSASPLGRAPANDWRDPGACKFSCGVQCFVNYPERCLLDSDRPPVGSSIRATGK
jgi:hypothetical protein